MVDRVFRRFVGAWLGMYHLGGCVHTVHYLRLRGVKLDGWMGPAAICGLGVRVGRDVNYPLPPRHPAAEPRYNHRATPDRGWVDR